MNEANNIYINKEIKNAFKPAVLFGTGYVFQNFLYFISTLIIARILGKNDFGLFSLAFSITGLISVLATLGLNTVPSKFIPVFLHKNETSKLKDFLKFIFKVMGITSFFAAFLIIVCSRYISSEIYKKPALILPLVFLALLIPLQRINELLGAVFQGFKKVQYRIFIQQFLAPAARIILLLIFLAAGYHFASVFIPIYSESILTLLIAVIILRKKILKKNLIGEKRELKCDRKEVLTYSLHLLIPFMINFLMGRIDVLILGYYRTAAEVGIYHIAFKLSLLVYLSMISLNSIFFPMISELFVKKDYKKLTESYKIFTRSILYVSVFSFGTLVFISPLLMRIPGTAYQAGIPALIILATGQIISVFAGPATGILSMTKYPRITLYNSLIQFTINIILDVILIPLYGIEGAAIATSASYVLVSVMRVIQIFFLLKMHPFSATYFKPILSGISGFLSVKAASSLGLSSPLILTTFFVSIFTATTLLLGIGKEEKYMLSLLKNYRWKFSK